MVGFDFSCNIKTYIYTIQKAHLCVHTCYQVFICRTSFVVEKTSLLFPPYLAITILLTSLNMTPSNLIVCYSFYVMCACSRQFQICYRSVKLTSIPFRFFLFFLIAFWCVYKRGCVCVCVVRLLKLIFRTSYSLNSRPGILLLVLFCFVLFSSICSRSFCPIN